jgi:hypothetical protein
MSAGTALPAVPPLPGPRAAAVQQAPGHRPQDTGND